MSVRAVLQCFVILGIISTRFGDALFQVSQSPQHKIVTVGGNITFTCGFPPFPDNSEVNVFWWRLGERMFLQTSSDKRKQYFIRKGQGSLQILDVRFQDAGVYYCGVKQQSNTIRNGTGSTIVVHALPANPTIVSKTPNGNSKSYPLLVCETVDFYPETITFSWYKNKSNVINGIKTTKQLNSTGLYKASSFLQETQPVQIGTAYVCLVSHPTLQNPKLAFYLVSKSKPDIGIELEYLLTVACVVSGLVCLVLGIIIGKRCQLWNRIETNQDGSRHCEEPTMRRTDDKKLTYAALNMIGSEKRGVHKQKGKSTGYAPIRLERHEREA